LTKTVLIYGLLGGVLIAGLRFIEYRYLVLEHSLEIDGGIVALAAPSGSAARWPSAHRLRWYRPAS
jgi:hypothetical protein